MRSSHRIIAIGFITSLSLQVGAAEPTSVSLPAPSSASQVRHDVFADENIANEENEEIVYDGEASTTGCLSCGDGQIGTAACSNGCFGCGSCRPCGNPLGACNANCFTPQIKRRLYQIPCATACTECPRVGSVLLEGLDALRAHLYEMKQTGFSSCCDDACCDTGCSGGYCGTGSCGGTCDGGGLLSSGLLARCLGAPSYGGGCSAGCGSEAGCTNWGAVGDGGYGGDIGRDYEVDASEATWAPNPQVPSPATRSARLPQHLGAAAQPPRGLFGFLFPPQSFRQQGFPQQSFPQQSSTRLSTSTTQRASAKNSSRNTRTARSRSARSHPATQRALATQQGGKVQIVSTEDRRVGEVAAHSGRGQRINQHGSVANHRNVTLQRPITRVGYHTTAPRSGATR